VRRGRKKSKIDREKESNETVERRDKGNLLYKTKGVTDKEIEKYSSATKRGGGGGGELDSSADTRSRKPGDRFGGKSGGVLSQEKKRCITRGRRERGWRSAMNQIIADRKSAQGTEGIIRNGLGRPKRAS